jgi:hypothetical protein
MNAALASCAPHRDGAPGTASFRADAQSAHECAMYRPDSRVAIEFARFLRELSRLRSGKLSQ